MREGKERGTGGEGRGEPDPPLPAFHRPADVTVPTAGGGGGGGEARSFRACTEGRAAAGRAAPRRRVRGCASIPAAAAARLQRGRGGKGCAGGGGERRNFYYFGLGFFFNSFFSALSLRGAKRRNASGRAEGRGGSAEHLLRAAAGFQDGEAGEGLTRVSAACFEMNRPWVGASSYREGPVCLFTAISARRGTGVRGGGPAVTPRRGQGGFGEEEGESLRVASSFPRRETRVGWGAVCACGEDSKSQVGPPIHSRGGPRLTALSLSPPSPPAAGAEQSPRR